MNNEGGHRNNLLPPGVVYCCYELNIDDVYNILLENMLNVGDK